MQPDDALLTSVAYSLKNSHLVKVGLDPESLRLKLAFHMWQSEQVVIIECRQIAYLSFSKTPDEEEPAYFVLDVFISAVTDGGLAVLDKLGFQLRDKDGHSVVRECQAYHLRTVGDVCIDVVCNSVLIKNESED